MPFHIALFQPDIAGNTGTILRFGACVGAPIHIIEPAGFDLSDKNLKRAGMDYIELATLTRHIDFERFYLAMQEKKRRLILYTTKASTNYTDFTYQDDDVLLFGRESAGVPEYVTKVVDACVTIPMQPQARSLNLAMSVAMAGGEASRQLKMEAKPLDN